MRDISVRDNYDVIEINRQYRVSPVEYTTLGGTDYYRCAVAHINLCQVRIRSNVSKGEKEEYSTRITLKAK